MHQTCLFHESQDLARKPEPIGIARLAAQSEPADARNKVDYHWIDCRTALNRVDGSRVSFEWSINPYRGCEIGCVYCYARYTHEFMDHRGPMDFERKIYVKRAVAKKLERELERGRCPDGETIVIGAATDPYQPAERRFEAMRGVLETLSRFSGYRVEIITKSDLILRDLKLLGRVARRHRLQINMTVTTTDAELARKIEPRAVTPRRRLHALRRLGEAGLCAGVFLMPILPWINDAEDAMESVMRAARGANAAFLTFQVLFLTQATWPRFKMFLAEHYPELREPYRQLYAGGTDAADPLKARLRRRANRLRRRYGLKFPSELDAPDPPPADPAQPELF